MSLLDDVFTYGSQHRMFSCKAILVAVSGGCDSVCLLDLLARLRDRYRKSDAAAGNFPEIFAIHVNHQIRPEASSDEERVRVLCEERKVTLFVRTFDVPGMARNQRRGLEETGRDARRGAFAEISREIISSGYSPVYVATAHHREDVCETILMNLFRGSGTDGLAGMRPIADQMIRPLLFADKKRILAHVRSQSIEYSEDVTNADGEYTRNAFRNEILPAIAKATRRDPVDSCLRTAELLSDDARYLDEASADVFDASVIRRDGAAALSCKDVVSLPRAISGRIIRMLYRQTFGELTDFSADHVESVRDLCAKKSGEKQISLPGGRLAVKTNDAVFFSFGNNAMARRAALFPETARLCVVPAGFDFSDVAFDRKGGMVSREIPRFSLTTLTFGVEKHTQVVYNDRTWYCSAGSLEGAIFRTMRPGDRFRKAGAVGHKPLRRLFTDEKIAREIRDRILIVARGDEVLWIPGLYHAEGFVDEPSRLRFEEEANSCGMTQDMAIDVLICVTIHECSAKGTMIDAEGEGSTDLER